MFGDVKGLVSGGLINWIWICLLIIWLAPNTQEIMIRFQPALQLPQDATVPRRLLWQPNMRWALALAVLALFAVLSISKVSEFLYFQF